MMHSSGKLDFLAANSAIASLYGRLHSIPHISCKYLARKCLPIR